MAVVPMTNEQAQKIAAELIADAHKPRREGGVGPRRAQHLTMERLVPALIAADLERQRKGRCGLPGNCLVTDCTTAAIQALPREGFILIAILSALIQWAVVRWLNKHYPEHSTPDVVFDDDLPEWD